MQGSILIENMQFSQNFDIKTTTPCQFPLWMEFPHICHLSTYLAKKNFIHRILGQFINKKCNFSHQKSLLICCEFLSSHRNINSWMWIEQSHSIYSKLLFFKTISENTRLFCERALLKCL